MSIQSKVSIRSLSKSYHTRSGDVLALRNIDLDVGENEFLTVVGTSGCGKSTLLSIAAGLQEATSGELLVDGTAITAPGRDRGVVLQSYTLYPWLTAQKNVEFALRDEPGMSRRDRAEVARQHLELVDLADFADKYPAELSGGMRQRVAIARSLSYRPSLLLMDEPFGALDALTRRVMQELLTEIWEKHRLTVIFITHDVEEAVFISDRVVIMSNRPGTIKRIVDVDLPRPREHEMIAGQRFRELYGEVLAQIHEQSRDHVGVTG